MIKDTQAIKPIGDRVLLRRNEEIDQASNGIFIPDSAKEKPQRATVVAVGTGRKTDKGVLVPIELEIGDTVIIGQYSGDEVRLGDITYTLIREDEILGILTDVGAAKAS